MRTGRGRVMGMDALERAAAAAGYAMASIDDFDDTVGNNPVGEAVARGARQPKVAGSGSGALVVASGTVAGEKTVAASLVDQSVAAGTAIRQAVFGYIGGRGAPA